MEARFPVEPLADRTVKMRKVIRFERMSGQCKAVPDGISQVLPLSGLDIKSMIPG